MQRLSRLVKHQLLPVQDPGSPVSVGNRVQTCGACHEKELETYRNSVHGRVDDPSAPVRTAFCADCHGTHGIYRDPDKRSMLHASQVATTCGKCHEGVETQLQNSVHAPGSDLEELSKGEHRPRKRWQKPTCTSCHQRHEPVLPESPGFLLQQQLPSGCGNCHVEFSGQKALRLHSQLTELGYVPAAKCSECHGAHDVLAFSNPDGRLANANRLHTCRECHPQAVHNFADFDPHANYKDAQHYPGLHSVHAWIETLIFAALIFFGVHTFLWLLRSLVHVLRFGRHKRLASDQRAIIRFSLVYRAFQFLIVVSLMGLALTGLLLRYSNLAWVQRVAHSVGGFPVASLWHKAFAILTIGYCSAYGVWIVIRMTRLRRRHVPWNAILFGPNSPVFTSRDRKDCVGMVRWFFGLGSKPTFERWTYWEKFDYWAVASIMVFIGTSGLVIWLPNLFARFLPGGALNLAEMIHSEVSLLVTGFLMAIHYFNTHFRPEKFPMDLSVLTGLVSEEHLQCARPEFLERMQREGRLEGLRTRLPSRKRLWAIIIGGYLIQAIGLALLSVILWAGLGG